MSETDEVMDIVASLIYQMGHTDAIHNVRSWQQTQKPLEQLQQHPLYQAAEKRRRAKFWQRAEEIAKKVDTWPAWMKGEPERKR